MNFRFLMVIRDRRNENELEYFTRDIDSVCGNHTWICYGIFHEERNERTGTESFVGICVRCDDRGIGLVAFDSCDRDVGRTVKYCMGSGCGRISAGNWIFTFIGYADSAYTPDGRRTGGNQSGFKKTTMLVLAVTLHNIPEGMAVGVTFAGVMTGNTTITLAAAFVLAIGIAIQNFPEGAIISMPLRGEGISRRRAFLYGTASGIVEPIAAFITILLTGLVVPILPYLLAFAAGAMIYVVVEELIPESQSGKHTNIGTIGVAFGFVMMMVLDVALG